MIVFSSFIIQRWSSIHSRRENPVNSRYLSHDADNVTCGVRDTGFTFVMTCRDPMVYLASNQSILCQPWKSNAVPTLLIWYCIKVTMDMPLINIPVLFCLLHEL